MFGHLKSFFASADSRTIGMIFCFNSILFGNWVTRIPDIKTKIGLSDAELGFALLGSPLGAIIIMPVSGWLIARLTLSRATLISLFLFVSVSYLPSMVTSMWGLTFVLFVYGLTNAFLDISMNAAAAIVEKDRKYPIMSTCHGMWSLGAMIGSLMGSMFIGFGVAPHIHLPTAAILIALAVFFIAGNILKFKDDHTQGHVFAIPSKALLGLALIAFCILLNEGAIADWSAVYMKETLNSNPFLIGLAFSGYAMLMALGRFLGDALIPRFGNRRIVVAGALLAVFGLSLALLLANPYVAIFGFSLVGLGFSCIVPVIFSVGANTPGMSAGAGIAAVATMGYTGFLAGPPIIGFISEFYGLTIALSLVIVLSLLVALLAKSVVRL